jgi:hypothetical protein
VSQFLKTISPLESEHDMPIIVFQDGVKGQTLWQNFESFKDVRDSLVHPRKGKEVSITKEMVDGFIKTSKLIIQLVSKNVWKKEVIF